MIKGYRNKELGVRKEWRKIICLKEGDGEVVEMNIKERGGKEYNFRIFKLFLV